MAIFVGLSILVLLVLLAQNKVKPAILFFGLLLVYYILDLIETKSMLNNFTNKSLVTLLLLLLVSIVFEKLYLYLQYQIKFFQSLTINLC